jgi:hypothetical protein
MSTDRETTRVVRSWLDEGVTRLPDRLLDAVLAQVPTTRQRRLNWLARRFPIMTSINIRFGIAGAAVIVALILGATLLPRSVASPPLLTPTVSPTASPSPRPISEGTLLGGRYILDPELGVSVEAPTGWAGCCGGAILKSLVHQRDERTGWGSVDRGCPRGAARTSGHGAT